MAIWGDYREKGGKRKEKEGKREGKGGGEGKEKGGEVLVRTAFFGSMCTMFLKKSSPLGL